MQEHQKLTDEVPKTKDGLDIYIKLSEKTVKELELKIKRLQKCLHEAYKQRLQYK